MANGLNKALLIGNLGQEPEVRYAPSGTAITTISVATSETWKDKTTGEKKERTEWHRCVMFNQLAEIAAKYLHKGSKVYLEGQMRTRKWQADDGTDRYSTEVVVRDMQMLDSKQAGGPSQEDPARRQPAPQQPAPPQNDFDQDIPF